MLLLIVDCKFEIKYDIESNNNLFQFGICSVTDLGIKWHRRRHHFFVDLHLVGLQTL
jgi:hypothetical protein